MVLPCGPGFSKAILHRSRAASSAEFCKAGPGGFGLISPIITLSASLPLFLGELSRRAVRGPVDSRGGVTGVVVGMRCAPERRSRAAAARLLAALNSGP